MSILVVDDSRTIQEIVSIKLKSFLANTDISIACDGKEALEKISEISNLKLIITDVNMPNMDGIQLIKAIRSNAKYSKIPILMLSTDQDKKEDAKQAGATGFITKPFNDEQFESIIKKVYPIQEANNG